MEHAVQNTKQAEHGADSAARGRPGAGPPPVLHPALQLQQQTGNQAMQQLLRSGMIRAKLAISQPDDPEEQEADAMAGRIMRSHAGPEAAATSCSCGSDEEEMCDECRHKQAAIARKATGGAGPSPPAAHKFLEAVRRSPGHPMDVGTRAFFEPRFGRDLSGIRIHTDASASSSARSIQANAFTAGREIYFASGQYSPQTDAGRRLLAHELAHVAQGTTNREAVDVIQRKYDDPYTYDPANESAWSYLGSKDVSKSPWQKPFEATLSAAPEAALDTERELQKTPDPATDEDRERAVGQIRTLIRLNALGLMASNRSGVERKRDELLNPAQTKAAAPGAANQQAQQGAAVNAKAIRSAAKEAVHLNQVKEELEDSERHLRLESTALLRIGGDSFAEALKKLIDETNPYRTDEIRQIFAALSRNLGGQQSLDRGVATAIIFNLGRSLAEWRHKQVGGIVVALDQIYEQFPFLTQLAPKDVPQEAEATDQQLMEKVRTAYGELLSKIDIAITKIGAGSIDPFDLPEAVAETRISLSPQQKQVLAQAMEHYQVVQFWTDMGLTLAQVLLVFVPVVGPALAAALGIGQLSASVSEMVDRYQVASATTTPEGGVLGVTGPSKLEWAMLGVQAALTVADLGGLWKEINSGRTHFAEAEPRLVEEEDTKITGNEREGELGGTHPTDIPGSPSGAQLHEEATVLRERMQDPENIRDVLDENLAKDYDYQVSVQAEGEQHTYYHRRDGGWCRASVTAFCGYSFGHEIEDALEKVRQARRPSASGKPTERYVEDALGPNFRPQGRSFEGKQVGQGKYGMSISDFSSVKGPRTVVEVKNIDIAANMKTGFLDLRGQVGGYLSNVPHPDKTKFWLFMDIRGQTLPPSGLKGIVESVSTGTGHVFDNIYLITEVGLVVY